MIGVIGQNELFQDFSISITSVSPPPIVPLLPSEYSRDITIYTEKYSYFSVPVDPLIEGKILITIDPIKVDHSAVVVQQELNDVCQLTQQLGRMLYTEDSLLSSGLCLCHQHSGSVRTLTINDSNPKVCLFDFFFFYSFSEFSFLSYDCIFRS